MPERSASHAPSSPSSDGGGGRSDAPPASRSRLKIPFWAQVFIGLAAGIALGFIARTGDIGWLATTLDEIGSIFVQLLRAIVVPLVLTAIIVSIANLGRVTNATRLAVQTFVWFAITALASVMVGIVIGVLTNPGLSATVDRAAASAPARQGTWLDFIKGIVPANYLGYEVSARTAADGAVTASGSFNVMQVVIIGLVLGAAALAVGRKAEPFLDITRSALEVFSKLVWWIIKLSPIGTAALIGSAVASYGWDLIGSLAVFTADVYIGCFIVLLVIYPIVARSHGLSIRRFYAGAWPAIQFAFVSRSSVGTLPLTQRVLTRNLGVPGNYASFAAPIGATTKMDGCAAIYPALAAITVAQLFGIQLGLQDYLIIAFVAVVGSAATAGLTGAVVMLTLTLSTLGLPLEGVGLLLAIDPILDMIRTATNVAGQALIPTIVSKREGILDLDTFNSNTFAGADERLARDETPERQLELQHAGA